MSDKISRAKSSDKKSKKNNQEGRGGLSSTPLASEEYTGITTRSVTRRRLMQSMEGSNLRERSDSITYVPLETRNDKDSDSPPPTRSKKIYEMNIINGEKSHLLVDEALGTSDDLCLGDAKSFVQEEETFWTITVQVFIPFLIAGMGMVGAGLVLDIVQVSLFLGHCCKVDIFDKLFS